jgi:hypothetical protein
MYISRHQTRVPTAEDQVRSSRKCGDMDLTAEIVSITKSRYMESIVRQRRLRANERSLLGTYRRQLVAKIASTIVLHREIFTRALERLLRRKPKPLPKPYAMGLMMKGTKLLKTKMEVIGRGEWI